MSPPVTQPMNFLAELRRRNVIRVAGLYVVSAWVLIQIAETLLPIFGTPAWVLQAMVVMLALGFLPVLVFSWVYEFTPDGLKRESELGAETSRGGERTTRRLDMAVIALLIVAIGLVARQQFVSAPATAPAETVAGNTAGNDKAANPRSIAVLAFDDLSAEGDQAYFAEGVSEELLNLLARIDGLKVAARTSSFQFKGGSTGIAEIGRALNVETVLEGSLRKAGDQVRVTAQLIRVADGFHIWSNSYDRRLDNIFAVQDEIAAAIVEALKLELDLAQETAGRTKNTAAYDLYLRASHLSHPPTRDSLLQAIALYEQALEIDPDYGAAYSGIAEVWVWLEDYGGVRSAEAFPKAEFAARRALALDPHSAEANAAMALLQDRYYNDLEQARTLYERALAISPNYVLAYNNYTDALHDLGAPKRMLEVQQRALELDPLSNFLRARLVNRLAEVGRVDEARRLIDALLTDAPADIYAMENLAILNLQTGRVAEAVALYRKAHAFDNGDPYYAGNLAIIATKLDDTEQADHWLAKARARGADNRYELQARESIALWRGDWMAVEVVGGLFGGERGARLRGQAAWAESRPADARRALNESLRLGGYRKGQTINLVNVDALLLLAWIDRNANEPTWQVYASDVRGLLRRVEDEGGLYRDGNNSSTFLLARLAALDGDRAACLAQMDAALARGFRDHWFLDRDPLFAQWREDPAFVAIVERIRAQAAVQREMLGSAGMGT